MRKLTYYAVFEKLPDGSYTVCWPDLPGCKTGGDELHQAEHNAVETLGLHIFRMEHDRKELPPATLPPFKDMPEGGMVMPITIFPEIVENEHDNRAVKTNITLPYWLKDWAATQGINLSQTLQTTLKEMFDASRM